MVQILDGRSLAQAIRDKVKTRVAGLGQAPLLAIILVGEDPASKTYVGLKHQACDEAGILFEHYSYPAETDENVLLRKITELNTREDVTGILVQLPLPTQDADRIVGAILPEKDVDGFHPENVRRLRDGKPSLVPPVHLGIMKLIEATGVNVRGQTAVIVSSALFAEPLVLLMRERGLMTQIVNPDADIPAADVLVTAVGLPGYIREVKPGSVVIDVGTTKVNGKIVGDVDRPSIEPITAWLSPVPGGTGPMTVAYLLLNVLKAHELQKISRISAIS